MALRALHPPVKEPLCPGWEIIATEAERSGRGIKAMLHILNGEPKDCLSIALGYRHDQSRFAEAVYTLCGLQDLDVKAILARLAYSIEDALRTMAYAHAEDDGLPGKPLIFEDIEMADEPVDGSALLNDLADLYANHIVLPPGGKEVLALWTVHTHTLDATFVSPYIILSSAQKRSGKSTTLAIASALTFRALTTNNISPAALFRTIEHCTPTLLIDEADTFAKDNEELRGILNSGHTRQTAFVIRTVGDNHEPRQFSTWAPKLIAGIGKLPDTLRDRAIILKMKRRKPSEKIQKWRAQKVETLTNIQERCARWANDHLDDLKHASPDIPEGLHDRAADNWFPLLAIADVAGGDWPGRARKAIAAIEAFDDPEEDNTAIALLTDIRSILSQDTQSNIPTLPYLPI